MKKKTYTIITLCLSMILLVSLCLIIGNYKKQKESFSSLCISEDKFNEIIKDKKQSSTPLLKELVFDGNELFFDEEDNRFYYSLVKESTTAYNPTIEWNGLLYNIAIKDNKITDDLIHYNQDIDILIYNNNQYTISKLTCTTLPLINVNVNVAMEDIGETYQDMHMIMFDNNNNSFTDLKGEIHTRGSHVMYFPKKSFTIKLKENRDKEFNPISLLDMQSDKFILYPGYNDQERIRNVFSTNLWYESCAKDNMFGIDNGQYYKYFELFLNGKYWGLYAMAWPIDEKLLKLETDRHSPKYLIENLYKKNNGAVNEYEIDWSDIPIKGYDLKTNKDEVISWKLLEEYYDIVFYSKSIDEIRNIIDVNNSIDIFLFYNLIQGIDNVSTWGNKNNMLHNTYMFTKAYEDSYKMLYCPWDMDRTWGNGQDEEPYGIDVSYNSIMYINPVFYLLDLKDNKIKDDILKRYTELRKNEWSYEKMLDMLDGYEKNIYYSGAYTRDVIRWPNSAQTDDELNNFKEYVINRLEYLDMYVEGLIIEKR